MPHTTIIVVIYTDRSHNIGYTKGKITSATTNAMMPPIIIRVDILFCSTPASCSLLNNFVKNVSTIPVALNNIGASNKSNTTERLILGNLT